MNTRSAPAAVVTAVEKCGVVAVVRLDDARRGKELALALAAGGVTSIEITMTVPNAVQLIEELVLTLPDEVLVGAGTVVDVAAANAVIKAGARFVVSPVFRPAVVEECKRYNVAVMPGCFTPTEILAAWDLGVDIVKVFPATALGPSFIKDIRGPMPKVKLMPTGGVTKQNAGDWIRAGAVAIGVGTALADPKAAAAGHFDEITANAKAFVDAVRHARGAVGAPREVRV